MSPNREALKPAARPLAVAAFWSALVILLSLTTTGRAQSSVTLAWYPSSGTNVVGYRLYQGCASRSYTNSVDVGNATSYTVKGLQPGVTYYFAVTAYDQSRLESNFSDEIAYTVPLSPPVAITSWHKLPNGSFSLSGTGAVSQSFVLLAASNLTAAVWLPVATNTANTQGVFNCTDLQATNFPSRFYRIRAL